MPTGIGGDHIWLWLILLVLVEGTEIVSDPIASQARSATEPLRSALGQVQPPSSWDRGVWPSCRGPSSDVPVLAPFSKACKPGSLAHSIRFSRRGVSAGGFETRPLSSSAVRRRAPLTRIHLSSTSVALLRGTCYKTRWASLDPVALARRSRHGRNLPRHAGAAHRRVRDAAPVPRAAPQAPADCQGGATPYPAVVPTGPLSRPAERAHGGRDPVLLDAGGAPEHHSHAKVPRAGPRHQGAHLDQQVHGAGPRGDDGPRRPSRGHRSTAAPTGLRDRAQAASRRPGRSGMDRLPRRSRHRCRTTSHLGGGQVPRDDEGVQKPGHGALLPRRGVLADGSGNAPADDEEAGQADEGTLLFGSVPARAAEPLPGRPARRPRVVPDAALPAAGGVPRARATRGHCLCGRQVGPASICVPFSR